MIDIMLNVLGARATICCTLCIISGSFVTSYRRRRRQLAAILSLSIFVTVIRFYSTTSQRHPGQYDSAAVDNLGRPSSLSSWRHLPIDDDDAGRGLLDRPDCRLLEAGDRREIALARAMMYRESSPHWHVDESLRRRTDDDLFRGCNFRPTVAVRDSVADDLEVSEVRGHVSVAFVVNVEDRLSADQTALFLRSVYSPSSFYCLFVRSSNSSGSISISSNSTSGGEIVNILRRLDTCRDNVVVADSSSSHDEIDASSSSVQHCIRQLLNMYELF